MGGYVPAEAHWRYRQPSLPIPRFSPGIWRVMDDPVPSRRVYALSGWSDRVFDVLAALMSGPRP